MQAAALVLAISREADGGVKEATFDQVVRRVEAQILRIAYRVPGNRADAEEVAQDDDAIFAVIAFKILD